MAEQAIRDPYSYPAKATIRDHWAPFAAENLPWENHSDLRVWFLPGPHVLELPGYLGTGLTIGQLQGFEQDPERARIIRATYPNLPLHAGPLKTYLRDSANRADSPDWAHLDFDGSVFTFADDVRETIRRLRLSIAPTLGVSSMANRDHATIAQSVTTLSLWASLSPRSFEAGLDLARVGNERQGLVIDEPAATYALCRELAFSFLILQSLGERAYDDSDERAASDFRDRLQLVVHETAVHMGERVMQRLGKPVAVPLTFAAKLRELFADRMVPIRLAKRLRFCCRADQGHNKWRWTWFLRFEPLRKSQSLLEEAENLLLSLPPLHVVDFTGCVIGDQRHGVCTFCPQKERG